MQRPRLIFSMRSLLFFGAVGGLLWLSGANAAEQNFKSGANRVVLIELFTSEGCSSCPPAERWLASLREAPGLWRDFVPLAFHVNYWDKLGWPDRFASREATQRQYAHGAAWKSGSVYTPCFVRDGEEWSAREKSLEPGGERTGVLALTLTADKICRVVFRPEKGGADRQLDVHLALLGSGLSSRVTAGENRGETLRHEFVVLAFQTNALQAGIEGAGYTTECPLPRTKIGDAPRLAVAAWVTPRGELRPLQATGGWLE
jgi:hypothetical protein